MRTTSKAGVFLLATALTLGFSSTAAYAIGDKNNQSPPGPSGGANGNTLNAGVGTTNIKVNQVSGGKGGSSAKGLAPVDPNWKPPACWYEPVATSEEVKAATDRLKKAPNENLVKVTPTLSWGQELMVNTFEKDKSPSDGIKSYKNFNLGKDGKFWRGVVNPAMKDDPGGYDCEEILFWQDAGTLPKIDNAPTPEVLASYAYDKVKVPDTKVELKPEARSTVNMPTWVWLDKGKFEPVKVRAELPGTNLWAETTAKPVALHLDPGTKDAQTFPASGDCKINDDGGIGTPYTKGSSKQDPPCGIAYHRSTGGKPFQMKASITWEITWEGSGNTGGDLPNGTFDGTQDVIVQEIQSINR
ncbi:hypothetical protein OG302_17300 [Streptomyces sp. NBC_01283]|uniref:hypothetical protein n=1 Tax=Streptomyces sp. NBC_01283 TaxID=2903812 RepID=UPI00352DF7C5|nr:hypothetical protein OG302_17300 [Streptomyces sp. NBC_01283]